jgi:hypothetical protein
MPQQEENHKNRLSQAREAYKNLKSVANPAMAGIKEVRRAMGLMKSFDPLLDWMFGIALTLAMLKDVLDFVGFGSFPAIGTAVTLCISFTIGLIMFITGSRGISKAARGMIKRFAVLAAGTGTELFFGLNFFPVETAVVIVVFYMTLRDRAIDREKEEKEKQASQQIQQQAPAQGAAQ